MFERFNNVLINLVGNNKNIYILKHVNEYYNNLYSHRLFNFQCISHK